MNAECVKVFLRDDNLRRSNSASFFISSTVCCFNFSLFITPNFSTKYVRSGVVVGLATAGMDAFADGQASVVHVPIDSGRPLGLPVHLGRPLVIHIFPYHVHFLPFSHFQFQRHAHLLQTSLLCTKVRGQIVFVPAPSLYGTGPSRAWTVVLGNPSNTHPRCSTSGDCEVTRLITRPV